MRFSLAAATLAAVFVPTLSFAASVPVCSSIALLSPSPGQHFIGSRPIHFSWSGEPVGTVSRELHLAALDGSEVVTPLDGRFSDTVKVKMSGDLAWAVVFKDAAGNVLCTSPAGLIAAGAGGGQLADGSVGSLSGTSAAGAAAAVPAAIDPRLVVGFTSNGRLVIVLQNSPYTGQYSKFVASDNYDGSTEDLLGAIGLEIYGNAANNAIRGSDKSDSIHLYGGDNAVDGGAGDDNTYVGPGKTWMDDPAGNDVDQYFVKSGGEITGSLVDGDIDDRVYLEPGARPNYSNDGEAERLVSLVKVPSVPE